MKFQVSKNGCKTFFAKARIGYYLLVISFVVLFFGTNTIIWGLNEILSIYNFCMLLPMMLVGGGLEEAGWRYILQPELNKRYSMILSAIITGAI